MDTQQQTPARSTVTGAWAITVLLTGLIAASVVTAQNLHPTPTVAPDSQTTTASADALASSLGATVTSPLFAVNGNRAAIIDTIVNQWKVELEAGHAGNSAQSSLQELRSTLQALRADQLLAASLARTFDGMKQVFASADAAAMATVAEKSAQKLLGSATADLVYTPVAPCKLVDTRPLLVSPYGVAAYKLPMPSGSPTTPLYDPNVAGTPCVGIPISGVAALHVSATTSFAGSGSHILSLMSPSGTAPVSNVFGAGYSQVTTLVATDINGRFRAQVSTTGVDLLVDIVGYFAPPKATPLQCIQAGITITTAPAGASNFGFSTSACNGYTVVSVACNTSANSTAGLYFLGSALNGNTGSCAYNNTTGISQPVPSAMTCCRVPGL